jgi:hypothetical protein
VKAFYIGIRKQDVHGIGFALDVVERVLTPVFSIRCSQAQEYSWTAHPLEKGSQAARAAGMAQAELDRFGDHRIRIDVLLTVDVSVPAYHAVMVRDNQPASVELARVELQIVANNFRDVVAVHGLLGGGRFGHIGVLVILGRAHDGCQTHDDAAVVVARGGVVSTFDNLRFIRHRVCQKLCLPTELTFESVFAPPP